RLAAQRPIVQQPAPAQQPPVIVQQPAPVTTQPAPIIVTPPAGGTVANNSQAPAPANVDANIQTEIDKRLSDDSTLSTLGITATVIDAKVTLIGTAKGQALTGQLEGMVKQAKGVNSV